MSSTLGTWDRPYFQKPGGRPFLFYVVYGSWGDLPSLSRQQYRSTGIFPGLDLQHYSRAKHSDVLTRFQDGYVWDTLSMENPGLAGRIREADQCMILKGEIEDQPDLNYLRDSVGLLTFLLDHGGVGLYDPWRLMWWEPEQWYQEIFQAGEVMPLRHTVILFSDEPRDKGSGPLTWYHTRGMRKFGRPDLSVHSVPPIYQAKVIELCNRFIQLQAFGGVIEEGMEVRVNGLPKGMICHHAGHLDDYDFNNVHVGITPPQA